MQVKCDRCGQNYEVNDSRISPQGAKIKCPSCANIFVVRPAKNAAAAQEPASNPNDSAVKLQTPIKPKSAAEPKSEPPKVEEDEWRIQNMGLTYTFHDLESLHNWLAGRPALDGVKIAHNKDDWKELGDYPDVMTTELITKFFPLGDVPTSKSVKAQNAESSGEKIGTLNGGTFGTLNGGSFGTLNGGTSSVMSEPMLSGSSLAPVTLNGSVSAAPISKATDLSTAVTSKSSMQQLKKERAKAKQVKKDSQKQLVAFGIIIALLVVVGIFVLRYWRTGEIPFVDTQAPAENVVAQPETPAPEPAKPEVQKPNDVEPPPAPVVENKISYDEIERLAEEDYQRQLGEARDMVNKRKWPEARATLESMYLEHNDDPELLQLLAKTYRGLGMGEKANAMDAAAKKALAAKKELEKKQADAIHLGDE